MRRYLLALVLGLALSPALRAQAVVETPDTLPVLVGGLEGLHARVSYPIESIEAGEEGTAYVSLVVSATGEVLEASVLRTPFERLGEAALAAVQASAFEPGVHRGEVVASRMALAVRFRLPSEPPLDPSPAPVLVDEEARDVVETEPVLIGGLEALQRRVVYPEAALRNREQGTVFVKLTVDARGRPRDMRAERTPSVALGQAAVAAVPQSRFRPATRDGLPVESEHTLPVRFMISP